MAIDDVDDGVELAIVEEIADGKAMSGDDARQSGAFDRGNLIELFACHIAQEQRPLSVARSPRHLVDERIHVAVGGDEVLPAIIVEVEERIAPTKEGNSRFGDAEL